MKCNFTEQPVDQHRLINLYNLHVYIYIYIQRITMCPHGYHHSGSIYIYMCVYINIYIQTITMCPHGYHHNGFMETPALGTQEVRVIYIYIYTKILEVNLFAFAYRLFRRDFSPLDGTYCNMSRRVGRNLYETVCRQMQTN